MIHICMYKIHLQRKQKLFAYFMIFKMPISKKFHQFHTVFKNKQKVLYISLNIRLYFHGKCLNATGQKGLNYLHVF